MLQTSVLYCVQVKECCKCHCCVVEHPQGIVHDVHPSGGKNADKETLVESPGNLQTEHAQYNGSVYVLLLQGLQGMALLVEVPPSDEGNKVIQQRYRF